MLREIFLPFHRHTSNFIIQKYRELVTSKVVDTKIPTHFYGRKPICIFSSFNITCRANGIEKWVKLDSFTLWHLFLVFRWQPTSKLSLLFLDNFNVIKGSLSLLGSLKFLIVHYITFFFINKWYTLVMLVFYFY